MWIPNYEGGDNPLLIYLTFAAFALFLLTLLAYSLWEMYKKSKFQQICNMLHVNSDEIGTIQNFIKKFRIKDPLALLLKRYVYDAFIYDCANHFGNLEISDEEIRYEIDRFAAIREKLKFDHSYNRRKINSSRALPVDHAIIVKYYDPTTRNTLSYSGKVIENNEFFLGITVPKKEILDDLMAQKKPLLEVSFIREHDAEYYFESMIYRYNKHPKHCLFIIHSTSLQHGIQQKPLDIEASIMCQSSAGVGDLEVILELIDQNGCSFYPVDESVTIKEDASVILNCNLDGNNLSLQATINQVLIKNGRQSYGMPFTSLTEEVKKQLLHFAVQHTGKAKQKS